MGTIEVEIPQILKRLNVDHLDLLQVHWPYANYPLEETFETLESFKKKGLIRGIGVCNFSLDQLLEAEKITEIVSYQGLYNLFEPNADSYHGGELSYRVGSEILPHTVARGEALFPYSPLMQGLLGGRFSKEMVFSEDDVRLNNPKLNQPLRSQYLNLAEKIMAVVAPLRMTLPEVALGWLGNQEGVTSIIAGARTINHLEANIKALEKPMDSEIWDKIDRIIRESPLT